jgi:F0F1-type ATP synthase membrane subunit c/vacuolar-type H+-ATPase subunit K
MGVLRPDLMMKCIVPVVMAGIIAVSPNANLASWSSLLLPAPPVDDMTTGMDGRTGRGDTGSERETTADDGPIECTQIYGLVVSVLIAGDLQSPMALYTGFIQLGAGLSVGLAGLSAGFAIGIVGDAGVRGVAQQVRPTISCTLYTS